MKIFIQSNLKNNRIAVISYNIIGVKTPQKYLVILKYICIYIYFHSI